MSVDAITVPRVALAAAPDARAAARWAGLVVVCLGMMLTFLNITLTTAMLGPIQQDLHVSSATLVWVASVYTTVVASLVLSAGTLGDILGRRAVFMAGTAAMGAGSLLVFFATGPAGVIAGQVIMGVGGATILPNSLAIITNAFSDPHERTTAVSVWVAISGVGLAVGPLAGGLLQEAFSWQSAYLTIVALAIPVLALTPALVPDSRHPHRRLDAPGLVLGIAAIGALNYAVIEGGHHGFADTDVVAAFALAAVAALAFIWNESRSRTPMLHLPLFRIRSFSTANVTGLVSQYAFVAIALAQVLYFELVRRDSILTTGLRILPLMVAYVVVSSIAARIVRRAGFKTTIAGGLLLAAAGMLLMIAQQPATPYAQIAVLLAITGIGAGLVLPASTAAAVVSVPHQEGGMASATLNMFRQVGGALGASITGTILTTGHSFTSALHMAVLIAGVAALAAAGLTVAFVRQRPAPGNVEAQS
jgi:MFS family permease